ncbi:MAG: hypothetical protein AAFV80_10540 [Bacteroidota bacterium]
MNAIKIALGTALILLFFIISLCWNPASPETQLFSKTAQTLMQADSSVSFADLLNQFPELKEAQEKIQRISDLRQTIHRLTEGPTPNPSKTESETIQAHLEEIKILQQNIQQVLNHLLAIHAKHLP